MLSLSDQNYWLAIETCHASGSIALMRGEKQLNYWHDAEPGTQVERMVPAIDSMLQEYALSWRDCTVIAVTSGPGSFTGVRIGLTIAKGLNLVHGVPVVPVGCMEVMACKAEGPVVTLMDARRGQLYVQAHGVGGVSAEPCLLPIAEVVALLEIMQDGIEILAFGAMPDSIKAQAIELDAALLAEYVWECRKSLSGCAHAQVEPLYIRPPDAKKSVPFLEKIRSNQT